MSGWHATWIAESLDPGRRYRVIVFDRESGITLREDVLTVEDDTDLMRQAAVLVKKTTGC